MQTKRTKKAPKLPPSEQARNKAREFLAPVIVGTTGYGAKKKLAEALSKKLGQPVTRHLVERWTQVDESKWQQPLLGTGLLLRETFEEQQAQQQNEAKKQKE